MHDHHMQELSELENAYRDVKNYYAARLARFGSTPLGVDWSCKPSQELRFVQLLKLCSFTAPFSISDLGCGYGALAIYLRKHHPHLKVNYTGIDLSEEMVAAGKKLHRHHSYNRFVLGSQILSPSDYSVASGIFNIRLGYSIKFWENLIRSTLTNMNTMSARGFSVNFLQPLKNLNARTELYCTDPDLWVRYCEEEFGCRVNILANYGQTEFTLIAQQP